MSKMKNLRNVILHIGSHVLVIYVFLWAVPFFRYAIPFPHEIPMAFIEKDFSHGYYALWVAQHIGVTLMDALSGYLLGNGVAITLALLIALVPRVERIVIPDVIALKSIPWVVLIPIFMLIPILGPTWRTRVLVVALANFFPTLINTHTGLQEIDADVLDYSYTLPGMNRWKLLRFVRAYYAVPYMFASFKTAAGNVITSAVVVEWMVASEGLGWMLYVFQYRYRMDLLYGLAILTGLMGYMLMMFVGEIEKRYSRRIRGDNANAVRIDVV
ncbi:MAG: ABC transporter permease subunit [bacterium]